MKNTENTSDIFTPKKAEILVDALTKEESSALREFILSKVPDGGSLNLPYRPDEWDSTGVIQKVQDLAKEHIRRTHVTINQLAPRSFSVSNISKSDGYSEEYSSYISDGEILYQVIATVSDDSFCVGGDTLYVNTNERISHSGGTTVVMHRCEELNNWKISPISGNRLDLAIYLQESGKRISYNYPIDQIIDELPDF